MYAAWSCQTDIALNYPKYHVQSMLMTSSMASMLCPTDNTKLVLYAIFGPHVCKQAFNRESCYVHWHDRHQVLVEYVS